MQVNGEKKADKKTAHPIKWGKEIEADSRTDKLASGKWCHMNKLNIRATASSWACRREEIPQKGITAHS